MCANHSLMAPLRAVAMAVLLAAVATPARAGSEASVEDAYARLDGDRLTLGTSAISKVWHLGGNAWVDSIRDERTGRELTAPPPSHASPPTDAELALHVAGAWIMPALDGVTIDSAGGRVRATLRLTVVPGVHAVRVHSVAPGDGAILTTTALESDGPTLAVDAYELQTAHLGWRMDEAAGEAIAFNGGSDWRADFAHAAPIHSGSREDVEGEVGYLAGADGEGVLAWMARRGMASSRILTPADGVTGGLAARVDLARDLAVLGPIPPYRVDDPVPQAQARRRLLRPGGTLAFEDSAVGVFSGGRDGAALALARLLRDRTRPYRDEVVYNTWGPFGRDIDEATVLAEIDAAAAAGAETFVLDDGWQDASGDWNLDPVKFPNGFGPLVEAARARGMRFGLWISPMNFHPSSAAFRAHPEWVAVPAGAVALYPSDSGFGVWSANDPGFRAYIVGVLERLIATGAEYFKLDFMVWVDDASPLHPGDMYDYHDAFVRLFDEIAARHPAVTFQYDETNDNRLFAYDSVLRGPQWFQNGRPSVRRKLENLAQLSPFVPLRGIGQSLLGDGSADQHVVAGLLGHPTIWTRLATAPPETIERLRAWSNLYRQNRALFAAPLAFPLATGDAFAIQTHDAAEGAGLVAVLALDGPASGTVTPRGLDPARGYLVEDLAPGATPVALGTIAGADPIPIATPAGGWRLLRLTPTDRTVGGRSAGAKRVLDD